MEKTIEIKQCKHCNLNFEITDKDLEFYDKISPVFNDKKSSIPTPALCPKCRQQRRMSFRNERNLYKRKCNATGENVVSIYSPDNGYNIYEQKLWWSNKWDSLDYGKDFDFSRGFFEQYNELLKEVPLMSLLVASNENSAYMNYGTNNKDSYMIYASSKNQNSLYSRWIFDSNYIVDSNNISCSSICYECADCKNIFSCFYCIGCIDSSNCYGCYDLIGCNNCIGSSNLRNKKYYIFNKPYSKEEYFKKKENLDFSKNILKIAQKNGFNRWAYSLNTENTYGEYVINTKNVINGFDVENAENCKNIYNSLDLYNSMDIDFQAFDSNYSNEVLGIEQSNNILYSFGGISSSNIIYGYLVFNSSNCFGCVGLKNKQYCIFNKQYTKEEYNTLVPKIIEHMKTTGEWGEFFPSSISPFGYNETVANEYFPLSKEEIIEQSFKYSDYESPLPKVDKIIPASKLPGNIVDIPDDILNWAIECEVSGKPFRIISQELEFYRKHNLPIPRKHPDVRHEERMKLRNPRKLFDRKCDKCGVEMKTTYSPDREEIVYCEECYNKEVY